MRLTSGKVYHIYNRGINSQKIFFENRNYEFFLQRFKRYVFGHVGLLTYSNHFHLLVRINEFEFKEDIPLTGVEKAFKNFFISYSKSINQAYNRTGALLQYKFKRKDGLVVKRGLLSFIRKIWLMNQIGKPRTLIGSDFQLSGGKTTKV